MSRFSSLPPMRCIWRISLIPSQGKTKRSFMSKLQGESGQTIWASYHLCSSLGMRHLYVPSVAPRSCLIRIQHLSRICGSDVKFWKSGGIGDYTIKSPLILGHESSGEVISVGTGVTHLKHGDRVSIEPGQSCNACGQCGKGRYNLCPGVE